MSDFSDEELLTVISDFLEKGLAENIVAMFKKEPELHRLTGELLRDERFVVRMGVAILYEELVAVRPDETALAIPALRPLLTDEVSYIRGEACNILGLINTAETQTLLTALTDDPDPQVREIVADFLA
ncbi:MAG: HEAT repeat domain-containing protein [Thermodesulfobacteriota bacterium]